MAKKVSVQADYEKVVNHLQIIRTWAEVDRKFGGINPDCCNDIVKWIDEALELLKEQEPIKPIRHENWWECPSCGRNIIVNMKYCYGCGKKVKWDGYAEGR